MSAPAQEPGELLRIGELASRTGKTIRALHLYEERGLLVPASRTKGGFRLYDQHDLARIQYIDRLQSMGLSLNEIAQVVQMWQREEMPSEAMAALAQTYKERLIKVRARISELQSLADELSEAVRFIEGGCTVCTARRNPQAACGGCARAEHHAADLPLIIGLGGRE